MPILRYSVLAIFILALVIGFVPLAALLAPYSAYGRIASNLFQPIYQLGNNFLAYLAARVDSYAFYSVDVWVKSWITFGVAAGTFVLLVVLAWRNGRTYCNTICPVGTFLGFFSNYSLFRITIDESKCTKCTLCSRRCKASCIEPKEGKIDYSRCVACMDCIDACREHAISYQWRYRKSSSKNASDSGTNRRKFLSVVTLFASTSLLKAQEKKVDGGLATIEKENTQ